MLIERVRCVLCPRRFAVEGYRTCNECADEVRDALDDIVRLYAEVAESAAASADDPDDLWPTASKNTGSRTSVYRSTPPVDLDKLDTERRHIPNEVVDTLGWWAGHVRASVGMAPLSVPPTVVGEIKVLTKMWSWIRAQQAVGDLGRDVLRLRDSLRKASGVRWVQLGRCPQPPADRSSGAARCGQMLYARLGARTVRCSRCGTPYPSSSWSGLARRMES